MAGRNGSTGLRIATWNVERVSMRSWKRLPAIREAMAAVQADIWVLTETRESLCPAEGFHSLHCPPLPGGTHQPDERMVSIWSRWPIEPTGLEPRARGAVSGYVESPAGRLAVFGSVVPYMHDRGPDGRSRAWAEHYAELERLAGEWADLARHTPLVVAGDLNQDRDGSSTYGTRKGRELLGQAMAAADLVCLTDTDMVATGQLAEHHLIDHVLASRLLVDTADVACGEPIYDDGVRVSDHPAVVVAIDGRGEG